MRGQIERIRPPRALYCDFPLGRPLGRPGDPGYQHRVLAAAFELLRRPSGPVLEDFPETVVDEAEAPLACAVPPSLDPAQPPAVGEALALRPAYERTRAATGRTLVGRFVDADGVPGVVAAFERIAAGTAWQEAGLGGPPHLAALDVRAYYEEAALALADHVPAARSAEAWLFRSTEAGRLLHRAQAALRAQGYEAAPYVVPFSQQQPVG